LEHLLEHPAAECPRERRRDVQRMAVMGLASGLAQGAAANPLVPTPTDAVAMIAALVGLVLALLALVSVLRAAALSGRHTLAWAVFVLVVPYVGAVMWFVTARRGSTARAARGADTSR